MKMNTSAGFSFIIGKLPLNNGRCRNEYEGKTK